MSLGESRAVCVVPFSQLLYHSSECRDVARSVVFRDFGLASVAEGVEGVLMRQRTMAYSRLVAKNVIAVLDPRIVPEGPRLHERPHSAAMENCDGLFHFDLNSTETVDRAVEEHCMGQEREVAFILHDEPLGEKVRHIGFVNSYVIA